MMKLFSKFSEIILFGNVSRTPQRQLAYGYLTYSLIGALILCLPFSQTNYVHILDNLFISVSALSTTGLATISISDNYTFFGQLVVLALIQIGGIGYMTFSSFLILKVFRRLGQEQYDVVSTGFAIPEGFEISKLIKSIIAFTFSFEAAGAIVLFFIFSSAGENNSAWKAVFHSISSFCTAGFGLFNDSFEQYKFNNLLNITISILSYAGGIGFIVLLDAWDKITGKRKSLTFTSKVILSVTVFFSLIGTLEIYLYEPSIRSLDDYSRLVVSFFQAMTAMTTVGFNTIPISSMQPGTLMMIIILMYIGASPSGTGGGLKSTTITAVWAFIMQKTGLKSQASFFGKIIPDYRIQSAITVFIFYTSILFFGSFLLTFSENHSLLELLFEAASALGTVGLSMGITSDLSSIGKLIIIMLMFIGRVGVITFGNAILLKYKSENELSDLAI